MRFSKPRARRAPSTRLALVLLEDRTVPATGLFFDLALGDLMIVGSDANDNISLTANLDGEIVVMANGNVLQALDPKTNQPEQPTIWNTDSILTTLRAGDDVFDFFADQF